MARASDFDAISRGLDSIRQSILQRKLEEYRAERDAEERSRYEAQTARQLKLDADMGAYRTAQLKNQTDAAAALAAERKAAGDYRAWQMKRTEAADAAAAAAQAKAAGQQEYFNTALRASDAGPAMQTLAGFATSPDLNLGKGLPDLSGMTPQDFQPQPLTNERVLRAETAAGLATPQGAQRAAMGEEKLAAMAAKLAAGPAAGKHIEPQLKTFTIGGKDVTLIFNPATGSSSFPPDPKTNKPNIRDVLAVGKQVKENTARMAEILSMDPSQVKRGVTDKEYRALEKENRQLNDMLLSLMDAAEQPAAGATAPANPGAAAPAPSQPAVPPPATPAMKFDITPGGVAQPVGAPAPAPEPREQQDGAATPPPVSVQPPKPDVSAARTSSIPPELQALMEPNRMSLAPATASPRTASPGMAMTPEAVDAEITKTKAQLADRARYADPEMAKVFPKAAAEYRALLARLQSLQSQFKQ